jgi:hypothetical protein
VVIGNSEEKQMPTNNLTEPFKLGDLVKIKRSGFDRGRIVELRGALGPKGANVYRLQVGKKPYRYFEVLEEQLEAIPHQ